MVALRRLRRGRLRPRLRSRSRSGRTGWSASPAWCSGPSRPLLGLIGVSGPVRFVRPLGAEAVSLTTGAFGLLAVGARGGAAAAARVAGRPDARPTTRTRLRELLDRYGDGDSLGYFALRADKSLIWAPSGQAAVAYRVINGVSLAAGDPIGARVGAGRTRSARGSPTCAAHGWTPAVLGLRHARAARRTGSSGLDVIELGDEAILDVGRVLAAGPRRCAACGRRSTGCGGPATPAPSSASATWPPDDAGRGGPGAPTRSGTAPVERGFSMALSRLGDPRDGDCLLVLCRDAAGRLRGLLQFVPWGADGLSLDLMRGDRTADNGLTELMVVSAVEAAPALGRTPDLAELRRAALGLRPGRGARRRTGDADLAPAAAGRVPAVADRVAVPGQRQVPAGLAAAVPVLPDRARPAPHRGRGAQRRGVPAGPARRRPAAAAPVHAGGACMSLTGVPLILVAVLATAVTAAATVLLWSPVRAVADA